MPNITIFGGDRNNGPLTMSSREIAELLEKRHDDVKRSIQRLAQRGTIGQPPMADDLSVDAQGKERTTSVYRLEKRDTYIVVAQLSPEFTARVVDRWQELESGGVASIADYRAVREARLQYNHHLKIGKMIGLTGNQLALSANAATYRMTGVDTLAAMSITHMPAPQQEALLTPTDIAKRMEMKSGQAVNLLLNNGGFQTAHRDGRGNLYYEPTDKGLENGATFLDTGKTHKDGTPVRQLKWASRIIDVLRDGEAA